MNPSRQLKNTGSMPSNVFVSAQQKRFLCLLVKTRFRDNHYVKTPFLSVLDLFTPSISIVFGQKIILHRKDM